MERGSRNKEGCPQLLDLIHKDREWLVEGKEGKLRVAEEKKLELRLGPPGEDWSINEDNRKTHPKDKDESSSLCLGRYSSIANNQNISNTWIVHNGGNQKQQVGAIFSSPWGSSPSYLQFTSHPQKAMESSKAYCTKGVGELQQSQAEKKACSQPSPTVPANTAVNNSSQKRSAPAQVVGWPPVRSFRKNLASGGSSKQAVETQNGDPPKQVETKQEICNKGMFVKINMDGVAIGRKVDLKAFDSYEKLSSAVDELFRGLLAAQRDSPVTGNLNKVEDVKQITGLLDGSGEYTLVYEDNEGDRMLVGDVPWDMFANTVKRLRVLKSSELSALRVGSGKQGKIPL